MRFATSGGDGVGKALDHPSDSGVGWGVLGWCVGGLSPTGTGQRGFGIAL
ncbi:MAG: hypothetical protein WAK51_07945 [Opitutaceae bacterium]